MSKAAQQTLKGKRGLEQSTEKSAERRQELEQVTKQLAARAQALRAEAQKLDFLVDALLKCTVRIKEEEEPGSQTVEDAESLQAMPEPEGVMQKSVRMVCTGPNGGSGSVWGGGDADEPHV